MYAPRPKGRPKKRLTLNQVENQQHLVHYTKNYPKEKLGRQECIEYARKLGWLIIPIHCDEYLKGYPDTIWHHKEHGIRHVEFKSFRPGHCLEPSQVAMFHNLAMHGTEVWVLRSSVDYNLLFGPPNWRDYLPIVRRP